MAEEILQGTEGPILICLEQDMAKALGQALAVRSYFSFMFLLLTNLKGGKLKTLKNYVPKDIGIMAGLGFLGLFLYLCSRI